MISSELMIKTLAKYLTGNNNKHIGGNSTSKNNGSEEVMIFMLLLLTIFINGLIVYIGYNLLMPKLIFSVSGPNKSLDEIENNFRPLNYWECVVLVILTKTLF
jgi:hypothetical protein